MRAIHVSIDTFAAIWKAQMPGEATEDAILRRVLRLDPATSEARSERDMVVMEGFVDPRYNVVIPSDFRIFRTYLGQDYEAQALQGSWWLHGNGYGSLNELSKAIGIAHENAWANWFYNDEKGKRRPLTELRDPKKIVRRPKPVLTLADMGLE